LRRIESIRIKSSPKKLAAMQAEKSQKNVTDFAPLA
jgi:hypothetical protein